MLTKKIHSQPRYFVRTPPASTPTAAPEPPTAPQTPSALFRSAPSVNVVETIERPAGETIAAPRPWTARAAISTPLAGREAADERGGGEQDQAEHEDPPAAEQVGGAAAEQQEAAERDRVGRDHPLQLRLGEVEVARRSTAARR